MNRDQEILDAAMKEAGSYVLDLTKYMESQTHGPAIAVMALLLTAAWVYATQLDMHIPASLKKDAVKQMAELFSKSAETPA
jgi:hypothetical protein